MPPASRSKRKQRTWVRVLRWTIAVAALAATLSYGVWKGGNVLWIAIPGGVLVMFCTAAALTVPVVTATLVAVAFIHAIDSGIVQALRDSAAATVAVGMAISAWQIVKNLRERDRRR